MKKKGAVKLAPRFAYLSWNIWRLFLKCKWTTQANPIFFAILILLNYLSKIESNYSTQRWILEINKPNSAKYYVVGSANLTMSDESFQAYLLPPPPSWFRNVQGKPCGMSTEHVSIHSCGFDNFPKATKHLPEAGYELSSRRYNTVNVNNTIKVNTAIT